MKAPKMPSKPLMIIEHNEKYRQIFGELDSEMAPIEEEHQKLHRELTDLHKRMEKIQSKHSKFIKKELVKDGLIDGDNVSMYITDGVLYQGRNPNEGLDLNELLSDFIAMKRGEE